VLHFVCELRESSAHGTIHAQGVLAAPAFAGVMGEGKEHIQQEIILDIGDNMFYERSIPSHPGAWLEPSCHGEEMRLSVRVLTDDANRGAGETKLRGPDTTVRTHARVMTRAVIGCRRPATADKRKALDTGTTRPGEPGHVTDTSRPLTRPRGKRR